MRTQEEIEGMQCRAMLLSESEWAEAVNTALSWVLGDNDDNPLQHAVDDCREVAKEHGEQW